MAGLLGDMEDPRTQGLLSLGFGLMNSRGNFGQALGQAGPQAMDQYNQAAQLLQRRKALDQETQNRAQQMQMAQAQLAEFQRNAAEAEVQRGRDDQFRQMIPAPMGGPATSGPTDFGNFSLPGAPADPHASMLFQALQQKQIKPMEYLTATQKDRTPIKLGAGESLFEPGTFKPLATNPKESEQPAAIKEYAFAKSQGYGGTFQQFVLEQKRAGATSLMVNTAKPLLNTVAEGLGKNIDASLSAAQAALPAIQTAQTLKSAVDTGKLIAGPGSTFRVLGLQVGQMLGVGGKDGAEVLANTRTTIQSMAKAELEAAQQMKGQGQITEAERGIIRRAASGDIDSLTAPEIRILADSMEKTARYKIKTHQANVKRLGAMEGAAPLVPFYGVDEPPSYSGGASRGLPDASAIDAEIARRRGGK